MCGIAGFIGKGNVHDLEGMVSILQHRGPDDSGVYFENNVGLAHTRLSIIDLSPLGHQPMWDKSGSIGIVFNGEIYNFQDLREELLREGQSFISSSDTEVIIALYKKLGDKCFARLEGMFAIAIFDKHSNSLTLARDRMGKKPLYYGVWDNTFVFASEPGALFRHQVPKKEIDPHALNSYLALDYVPTPMSIWKGVFKMLPGHTLKYKNEKIILSNYWQPEMEERKISLTDAIQELDGLLDHAVSSRLVADVPLGIFLSGGLDSSAIAYYASKIKKDPVHTFSIGFSEKTFDESRYAKIVAQHLGTTHHHKVLTPEDSLRIIPKIFSKLDEPMADASILPTHLLSSFSKEYVTVALGGDGGDELFAGYPTFQAERAVALYQHLPSFLTAQFIPLIASWLPTTQNNFGLKFKLEKFLEGANEQSVVKRHMRWLGSFSGDEKDSLLAREVKNIIGSETGYEQAQKYFSESLQNDERNKLLWVYQHSYMMDQVMVKVDRASMYASLETRAPFLDRQLVEFANSIPYHLKLHGNTTKYLLKKTMEGKLPTDIIYREKKGFGVPIGAWLTHELKAWAEELLFSKVELFGGMLSREVVERLWGEHQSGARDNRKKLWNLLVLLEWERQFLLGCEQKA